jgi:aspartate racemase
MALSRIDPRRQAARSCLSSIEAIVMKTMGLIGGMSWESTATYYRLINEDIKARLGGHHSAKLLLYSVDFAEIEHLQKINQWSAAGDLLAAAARSLQNAGAEFIVLCTNTMHKVAAEIESAISIPLLHIADPTAQAINDAQIKTVALLGTRFTMEQEFYAQRLRDRHSLTVLIPPERDRQAIHNVIYEELTHGKVLDSSRAVYLRSVDGLIAAGAQGIIFGCTEISMLITPQMISVPCFDTTALHAKRAVDYSLESV